MFNLIDLIEYHKNRCSNNLMAFMLNGRLVFGSGNKNGLDLERKFPISKENYNNKKRGIKIKEDIQTIDKNILLNEVKREKMYYMKERKEIKKIIQKENNQ